jgi:hypothetical protein
MTLYLTIMTLIAIIGFVRLGYIMHENIDSEQESMKIIICAVFWPLILVVLSIYGICLTFVWCGMMLSKIIND